MRRLFLSALFGSLLVATAGVAHANAQTDFDKARAAFQARNWTDAEEKLRALLDPKSGLKERPIISQSRMYLGATLLQLGKKEEAKELFEKLVLDDPTFEPDPLGFPGTAIDTFIDVRSSLLEQIKNAQQTAARLAAEKKAREDADREAQRVWLEKVKAQAGEEKITVRHSRVIASIPFGVGQFQNDQTILGFVFLGAQVAAIGGTAVTYGMFRYALERQGATQNDGTQRAPQWKARSEDLRGVNLGFVGGFLGLAIIGVVQAQIAYVPEVAETKKRDLPPLEPQRTSAGLWRTMTPIVAPGAGGVYIGTAATF